MQVRAFIILPPFIMPVCTNAILPVYTLTMSSFKNTMTAIFTTWCRRVIYFTTKCNYRFLVILTTDALYLNNINQSVTSRRRSVSCEMEVMFISTVLFLQVTIFKCDIRPNYNLEADGDMRVSILGRWVCSARPCAGWLLGAWRNYALTRFVGCVNLLKTSGFFTYHKV